MKKLFNCVQLKQCFPRKLTHDAAIFVEGTEEESNRFFAKHGVKTVRPFRIFRMVGEKRYTFIGCEFRKKESPAFHAALYEMQSKMLILGYRDYEEFCRKSFVQLGLVPE